MNRTAALTLVSLTGPEKQHDDRAHVARASEGADADACEQFVTTRVFAALPAIAGHRGAYLLRRSDGEHGEFIALTLWDSADAIRKLAGDNIDRAVVEPEARALLSGFDDAVRHFELA